VIGCALWAKYFIVVLAAPYALFLLLDPKARRALKTPGPWLGVVVAFVIMAPHLLWLIQTDFLPLAYAEHRASPVRGWFDHVLHPAAFTLSQIFFMLPSLFIAAALIWPKGGKSTPLPTPPPQGGRENEVGAFERRIVTLLAFGPGLAMIALTAVSGRGAFAMWGYPLWLFVGLWIVMMLKPHLDRDRLKRVIAAWGAVFAVYVVVFVVNYSVLPRFDHRYRAAFFPGDRLGAELTERFHAATGKKLAYVIGSMWDGGNLAHYSPDQPEVLVDGLPRRAPWIDLADLRRKGAVVVWTDSDPARMPTELATVAGTVEIGAPLTLPMRRGSGEVHVGWAILRPE